MRIVRQQL